MGRATTPVIIDGIEFDCLLDESKGMTATVPSYPVEDGFNVSDTIINDPIAFSMSLLVADSPITWSRHGRGRCDYVCNQLEALWLSKKLVKIITSHAIFTNMGIEDLKISHSQGDNDTRKIEISVKKVDVTQRSTAVIPATVLKSGATKASGGTASKSDAGTIQDAATPKSGSGSSGSGSSGSSSGSSDSGSSASILYGVMYGSSSSTPSTTSTSRRISGAMEY